MEHSVLFYAATCRFRRAILTVRAEQQIFDDLAILCSRPGYAHAIAYFCFRDHIVTSDGGPLKGENYAKLFSLNRLIRTEISTLIGLFVRGPRDLTMPDQQTLEGYVESTEGLLRELHDALNEPIKGELHKAVLDPEKEFNPFASAAALREPIFYGAESAYDFQYRDLAVEKYKRDEDWLRKYKRFSLDQARQVATALNGFLSNKLLKTLNDMKGIPPEKWTVLDGFQFTVADIALQSGLEKDAVEAVVDAFACPDDGNPAFSSLSEFNAANAFPVLKVGEGNYILFLSASLSEALYDTPFYWMSGDKAYAAVAMTHRGAFTEKFSAARLAHVFGDGQVFRNVDIWETSARKKKLGEIDVLVLFGDRAIVVQAKSKKLTLAARKGNDLQLKADFKAAVQDACDQAVACGQYLIAGTSILSGLDGKEIELPKALKKIHPVCVVAEHYPALSFQAQQFLSFKPSDLIEQPLVCDVFFIDVVTEFLETPLRFLSYLELRARAAGNLSLSHEIVALGYHLRQNLWLGEYDFMVLGDDLSIDVDIAMMARREGIDGEKVPPGILTHLKDTAVGRIIADIEKQSEPGAIGIGLELLKLGEKSANDLSRMVNKIVADAKADGFSHDVTVPIGESVSGITIHCNALPSDVAHQKLQQHCRLRKYSVKASTWFGLLLRPGDGAIRLRIMADYPWVRDVAMDAAVAKMPAPKTMRAVNKFIKGSKSRKIGRNHPCPCGSGLKYKRCHLLKQGVS